MLSTIKGPTPAPLPPVDDREQVEERRGRAEAALHRDVAGHPLRIELALERAQAGEAVEALAVPNSVRASFAQSGARRSPLVVPGQVAMLPLFLMLKQVGLINSYAGVVAPWLAGIFGVLFVRQAALSLPDEMLDAARIDGASEWQLFRDVVTPLLRPVIVTLALFTFLGSWNDFLWPLIVLSDDHLHTLPVALAALSREHVQEAELMMAGAVVTTLPVLLIFLPLQRFYIASLFGGAIKG